MGRMLDFENYYESWKLDKYERVQEDFRNAAFILNLNRVLKNIQLEEISLLEIGPGFQPLFKRIENVSSATIVEPMSKCYERIVQSQHPEIQVDILNMTIEEFLNRNKQKFDLILLVAVLPNLLNLEHVFGQLTQTLTEKGIIASIIPNMNSLHLLHYDFENKKYEIEFAGSNVKHGHYFKNLSKDSLLKLYSENYLKILLEKAIVIKPYSHKFMSKILDEDPLLLYEFIEQSEKLMITAKYGSEYLVIGGAGI